MSLTNDLARGLVRRVLPLLATRARRDFARRIRYFRANQDALRVELDITAETPIAGYDEATRARIEALAAARPEVRLATTSGSTGAPKPLAYPPERLRDFARDSGAIGVMAFQALALRGASFFVLGSLTADRSFATLVLHKGEPSWVQGLVEPARYLTTPAMAPAIERYGATAARLWLMLLADPGMIYSTNPSTLAVFLTELDEGWDRAIALTRDWVDGPRDPALARIARRVASRGAEERLSRAARSEALPPLDALLPGLGAYCCWDGGYVRSFLRTVHRYLPPERFVHVPMYAMSTETIETLTWFEGRRPRFLPLGPGVLYELLPEGAPDAPEALVDPESAEEGARYALVVSDRYGLRRYQTEDLFRCHGHVEGLPDLRFEGRRGLTWSYTGEKLTGEQLVAAYAALEEDPAVAALNAQATLFPSWPEGAPLPGYRLVLAPPGAEGGDLDLEAVARRLDEVLCAMNEEYASKRRSGRLAVPTAHRIPYDALAEALDGRREGDAPSSGRRWESQFKLAPLTRVPWEALEPSLTRG